MNAALTAVPLLASLALLLGPAASPASAQDTARVKARAGLNMRKGPSVRSAKIGALRHRETVRLLQPLTRRWVKVRSSRLGVGWCAGNLLEKTSSSVPTSARRGATGRLIDPTPPRASGGGAERSVRAEPRPSARGKIDTRNLSGLLPDLRSRVEKVLRRLTAKGWQPFVVEGRRTKAQQREKVRLGYSRTMNSKHLLGRAADIVDKRYLWQGPASRQSFQFWKDLGAAAKAEGLKWGGDWASFPDVAHVQR